MKYKTHGMLHSKLNFELDKKAMRLGTDKNSMGNGYSFAYEYYFASIKEKPLRILELGVFATGASINLWKEYFPNAQMFGIDIDAACQKHEDERISIYTGNLMDDKFMNSFLSEHEEGFDIIIDDASHQQPQLSHSLNQLFPYVKDQGVYIIEDLYTSYSPDFGMGYRKPGAIIEKLKELVDSLQNPEKIAFLKGSRPSTPGLFDTDLYSMHFYDGICFLFKGGRYEK